MSGGQDEASEQIQTSDYQKWRREHIAIAAMQGILSNPDSWSQPASVANEAIQQADELIRQLDNPTVGG